MIAPFRVLFFTKNKAGQKMLVGALSVITPIGSGKKTIPINGIVGNKNFRRLFSCSLYRLFS